MTDAANWRSGTLPSTSSTTSATNVTTVAEPSQKVRRIEQFDFTQATVADVPIYKDAKDFKVFRIVRKDGVQVEELIRIAKAEADSILTKIGKRFNIKPTDLVLHYSLQTSSREERPMRLVHVADEEHNKENLELFYTLAPETELLTIECVPQKSSRGTRKVEKLFKRYNDINTTNKRSYKVLRRGSPSICEMFLEKRRMIQLAMGSSDDCINLLSPSRFKCFVIGCQKVVSLKTFNSMASVKNHLKIHFDGNRANSNEAAKLVHRRIEHIEVKKLLQLDENVNKTNEELLEVLQEANNDGNLPLRLPVNIPVFRHGDKFKGAHYEVDIVIMQNIARSDTNPLVGYIDTQSEIS